MQGNGDMDEMILGPQISIGFPNLGFVICGLLTPKVEKDLLDGSLSFPGARLFLFHVLESRGTLRRGRNRRRQPRNPHESNS